MVQRDKQRDKGKAPVDHHHNMPRPLPRQVRPFPSETVNSYLRRLAAANRLSADALRSHIAGGQRRSIPLPIARLSVLTNLPEHTLRRALSGPAPVHDEQTGSTSGVPRWAGVAGPACRLCAFARGSTETVWCWKYPESVICLRHRRWVSSLSADDQPDLNGQPDIIRAHLRHLRLVRRLGRDAVAAGYAQAREVCEDWLARAWHLDGYQQRMAIFHGPGWGRAWTSATVAAAMYPQAVALARLLSSPYWQAQVRSGSSEPERFTHEVRRTAAPEYVWPRSIRPGDRLYHWVLETQSGALSFSVPR